ncbi:hypothetical protein [Nocardia blacklockiae]|uniref:hypothetical protein n=1 Tax=Nocardia blacklockiae TaxID=480036 RepID=UPI0018959643|nr:hypothetical protein [Nocardia blacklockiae]MBF6174496.1 hypothetical protein [Nocardia blacklockiae]
MVEEFAHLVEHYLPHGWVFPAALIFGLVVVVAVVVLLIVSDSDFDDQHSPPTTTHGTCAPFCTATGVPAQPH